MELDVHTTRPMRRIPVAGTHPDTVLGYCDSVSWQSSTALGTSAGENPDSRLRVAYEASRFPYVRVISTDVDAATVPTLQSVSESVSRNILTIVRLLLRRSTIRTSPRYEKICPQYKILARIRKHTHGCSRIDTRPQTRGICVLRCETSDSFHDEE
jgi:hypothetical protein